jgi:hypothetical protein
MTKNKALKIFERLGINPADAPFAMRQFNWERTCFTKEELSDETHAERLEAAEILMKKS